jgi:uncharacterized protein
MPTYLTPGSYIEEISTLPASVAPVSTAIPAFIGYTGDITLINKPTRITSFVEYVQLFGNAPVQPLTIVCNPTTGELLEAVVTSPQSPFRMFHTVQLYFANGGGPCYIISVGDYSPATPAKGDLDTSTAISGLSLLAKEDEPTLIVFPDATGFTTNGDPLGQMEALYVEALAQCEDLKDRFVIMDLKRNSDIPDVTNNPITIATPSPHGDFRQSIGLQSLKYGAAYFPWILTSLRYNYVDGSVQFQGGPLNGLLLNSGGLVTDAIVNEAKALINALGVVMPPSGAIAGIYASVDRTRGVWKAPANVSVASVAKPDKKITDEIQENMNIDTNGGKSINAIRAFTGRGNLVWGARTLAGNDAEWRYIPVRRLFIFVEESIKKATENVVFEANDTNTWVKVKGTIQNFLTTLWRQGALAGAKPEDAFFVKVGLGETMIPQDILEGNLIVEVGMAAVRPAEFIILRFSHKLQES